MQYQLVLWDLDGTLADTSPGVFDCLERAFAAVGVKTPEKQILYRFIGPPQFESFPKYGGLSQTQTEKAVAAFAAAYASGGLLNAEVYPGLTKLIEKLRKKGIKNAVATMKPQKLALELMEKLGLAPLLDVCMGPPDESGKISKAGLILQILEQLKIEPAKAVLIGDSVYDAQGARESGVDFVAAAYGFGLTKEQALQEECRFIAMRPEELAGFFGV